MVVMGAAVATKMTQSLLLLLLLLLVLILQASLLNALDLIILPAQYFSIVYILYSFEAFFI
jgi:hypothetical protein